MSRNAGAYVSLKDVATRAGVSFQTASKVLNGRVGVVSAATHARITAAARDLGYVPNALARGLVRQTSLTIGILVDELADQALVRFVMAAQRAAEVEGHTTLIVRARAGEDPELAVRKLREHRVAGIIVVAPSLEEDGGVADALRRFPPVVSLNHIDGGGIAVVGSNHAATGTVAAEHLLALGHQQIATITGPPGRRVVQSRHRGFKEALAAARVPLPARRVRAADWTPAAAYAAVDPMLGNDPTITAFFVHSDVMAVGVLRALHDHGRQIPDDYSIVGCDDLQAASYTIPSLTTVRVPFEETGDRAAKVLLQLVRGETPPAQVLLPIQLVVRHSTAAARTHDLPPPIASREKVPL